MVGQDACGRCLSTPDRLLRGVSAVLPMLGKLRGLGGATRLATEAGCSFAGGTPVVMADGTSRAVEALHAGDYVLAKDEKTGKVEAQEVTATVHHPAATLVTVTFAGADGKTQAIVCTPEHPFFVDGKGWVEAGSLGIGTSIVTRAGPVLAVKSLDWQRSGQAKSAFTVYNFTVDQDHTFFVGTANGGAWTHNGTCGLYQFSDATRGGKPYIGKSVDLARRLAEHVRDKRIPNIGAATETAFPAGTSSTDLEIAEQRAIDAAGGINSGTLANRVNPIGKGRINLMGPGYIRP